MAKSSRSKKMLGAIGTQYGKFILVIDDDPLVRDGMLGLLRSWGCIVAVAKSEAEALRKVADRGPPDLIIADYRLAHADTGFELIEAIRCSCGTRTPAFLISDDIAPERVWEARAGGFHLLHKPVAPMILRAIVNQLLKDHGDGRH